MGITISLLSVRRSILIQASPATVWQEFGSFERFAAWFGRGHELHQFEPTLGRLRRSHGHGRDCDPTGERPHRCYWRRCLDLLLLRLSLLDSSLGGRLPRLGFLCRRLGPWQPRPLGMSRCFVASTSVARTRSR